MDNLPKLDNDGHLVNHLDWNETVAQTLADSLGVVLEPIHYRVIEQVRAFFEQFHHSPATRPLIKHLAATLPDDEINNQKLQALFNTGLVARHVNRIAGLPKPPNCL
ncbi:TusE/DsrC/DsvC family sulfur relay protein [Moraxella nasicaprae]|uniref:Sulfurtransferase n=1 Tax=Moraxella nasicaprae TaxID=2904122 RepID=A0ABY6F464_9GAMM|nr:TusE/DsrC/DsvC family sulfur relay protein [Moraxella nasicaprae]UXZ04893.1 TusE/DsrC/DsvC family sulfur relay protein [Moraxella nasicaprae]